MMPVAHQSAPDEASQKGLYTSSEVIDLWEYWSAAAVEFSNGHYGNFPTRSDWLIVPRTPIS